jgi:hypothetical protein
MVTLCFVMVGMRLYSGPFHFQVNEWPPTWNVSWYGPNHFGVQRNNIERSLENQPGNQLVLVRYSSTHIPFDEWVYNAADIDNSKVIWAREMDETNNIELLRYYQGRNVWLVQPDSQPPTISPYPIPASQSATSKPTNATDPRVP